MLASNVITHGAKWAIMTSNKNYAIEFISLCRLVYISESANASATPSSCVCRTCKSMATATVPGSEETSWGCFAGWLK